LQVALPQDLKTNLLAPAQRRLQSPPAKSKFLAVLVETSKRSGLGR
jgi:hypothetical protein